MSYPAAFNPADLSPWPPVLNFTPEVERATSAAAALAFGPHWDTPMCELAPEAILEDMLRLAPDMAGRLLAMAMGQPA